MWPWDVLSECYTDLISLTGMLLQRTSVILKSWGLGGSIIDRDGGAKKNHTCWELRVAKFDFWIVTDGHVKRVEAVVWPLCLSAESSPGSHCSSCGIPARPPSSTLDVAFLWLVLHQQCSKVPVLFSGIWFLLWLVLQHLDIAYCAPVK